MAEVLPVALVVLEEEALQVLAQDRRRQVEVQILAAAAGEAIMQPQVMAVPVS